MGHRLLNSLVARRRRRRWIVWTDAVCLATGRCRLHPTDLTHHATITRDYLLPVNPDVPTGTTFSGGTISSDGQQLAFLTPRHDLDPRYTYDHPGPPFDIAVLHLDTGALDVIPGIELAPKSRPRVLGRQRLAHYRPQRGHVHPTAAMAPRTQQPTTTTNLTARTRALRPTHDPTRRPEPAAAAHKIIRCGALIGISGSCRHAIPAGPPEPKLSYVCS
jgi:hypothetical protein